jgi:signal transduction histidine kinase
VIFNSLGSLRRMLILDGDAETLFGILEEEARRLNRIVGDLLDFARPMAVSAQPEPLGRLVLDALEAATRAQPSAAKVQVQQEIDAALPPVPVDARLMRQALINVVSNAFQAMQQQKGGSLRVKVGPLARNGLTFAEIAISDTGPGIPADLRHRIFEPFFTTRATGTGLGLAVVKRIIEDHRGEVEIQSEPGAGTTFLIRLPLG